MEVDIKIVREYLDKFKEAQPIPVLNLDELATALNADTNQSTVLWGMFHYMNLLKDQGFIETVSTKPEHRESLGFSFAGGGKIIVCNYSLQFRLTNSGHQALEALKSPTLMSKLIGTFNTVGSEGLKQFPTLALEFIKTLNT